MDALRIRSPAKINLYLEVVSRRPDGYHEIESVMQLVDLCDVVRLHRTGEGIRVSVSGADLPLDEGNLAYRAAAMFLEAAGSHGGVHIHLEKRIPVAGGLGGGSSNAAAVLMGLSRLLDLPPSRDALRELAASLGSDVPFFLTDGLAVATGRGERLRPLKPWPPRWMVLANPGVPISTAWAYAEASSKLTDWKRQASIHSFVVDDRLDWPPTWAFNRLEAVVLPRRPEVEALKRLLQRGGAGPVLMSGSGASLFAVVPDAATGRALAAEAQASGAFAVATTTLPANPILEATGWPASP
jgi:4-diphosphocytidyl-2-C-methyl-D-erythritol kinase